MSYPQPISLFLIPALLSTGIQVYRGTLRNPTASRAEGTSSYLKHLISYLKHLISYLKHLILPKVHSSIYLKYTGVIHNLLKVHGHVLQFYLKYTAGRRKCPRVVDATEGVATTELGVVICNA